MHASGLLHKVSMLQELHTSRLLHEVPMPQALKNSMQVKVIGFTQKFVNCDARYALGWR